MKKVVIMSSLHGILMVQGMTTSHQGQLNRIKQVIESHDIQALSIISDSQEYKKTLQSCTLEEFKDIEDSLQTQLNHFPQRPYKVKLFSAGLALGSLLYATTYEYIEQTYHYDSFISPCQPWLKGLLTLAAGIHSLKCFRYYQQSSPQNALKKFHYALQKIRHKKNV